MTFQHGQPPHWPTPAAPNPSLVPQPNKFARWSLWTGLAGVLCWLPGPAAVVLALLGRDEMRKAPGVYSNPGQAKAGLVLGIAGTLFLVVSSVGTFLQQSSSAAGTRTAAPTSSTSSTLHAGSPSTASSSGFDVDEENRRADKAHADAVLTAAKATVAKKTMLETAMAAVDASLARKQIAAARRTVDGLWSDFVSLDKASLVPDLGADSATRDALAGAATLLARYEALQKSVAANELVVFDSAFDALWDPKNAGRNEDAVFASVGKKYGFTGPEVQAIYRRNEAEADRRLKARTDAEAKALETQCGSRPAISALDGGSLAAEEYVKRSAHDPSSVDVERCTEPKVNPGTCWTMTCDVRATNAFGAKVLSQVRFSLRQGSVVSAARL